MSLEIVKSESLPQQRSRVAGGAAAVVALGALACGVCCVLPFALPAAILATSGSVLAWFAGAHGWMTALAAAAVAGAWFWIGAQTLRMRRRPARSTLLTLAVATAILALAVAWPGIESIVVTWHRARPH
jgi:hypothetical protein